VVPLKFEPEFWSSSQVPRKQPRRPSSHALLSTNELVDPLARDPEMLGQGDLGDLERPLEVLKKDLAGMTWNSILWSTVILSDSRHMITWILCKKAGGPSSLRRVS
jgi:hypothetical protein